jgi:hypothetical protein
LAAILASTALLAGACGGGGESGAEKLIEQQTGGNVEIDSDGGGMSIETEDGSMTVDEDGNFVVTDDQGKTVTGNADGEGGDYTIQSEDGEYSLDSGGDIPDEWPDDVPEPSGIAELTAGVQSSGDATVVTLTGQADKDFVAEYGSQLEDAGFAQSAAYEDGASVNQILDNGTWTVAINLTGNEVVVNLFPTG